MISCAERRSTPVIVSSSSISFQKGRPLELAEFAASQSPPPTGRYFPPGNRYAQRSALTTTHDAGETDLQAPASSPPSCFAVSPSITRPEPPDRAPQPTVPPESLAPISPSRRWPHSPACYWHPPALSARTHRVRSRFTSAKCSRTICRRYRVKSSKSRISTGGIKLPRSNPCSKSSAIHADSQSPMAILYIRLPSRNMLDMGRIHQQYFEITLQQIEDRFPVNSGALHRDHTASVVLQPISHRQQFLRQRAKRPNLLLAISLPIPIHQTDFDVLLVNIHPRANRVHDL